jgi:hypothetical protein
MAESIGQVTALTAIAPIVPAKLAGLQQVLAGFQAAPESPIKRIATIHFARWVIIDGGTRLLFCSNFDGGWEDYLRDFSQNGAEGLNLTFGACEGWPGAQPFEPFRDYVKAHQVPTSLFYAAYPDLTVKSILKMQKFQGSWNQFLQGFGAGGPGADVDPATLKAKFLDFLGDVS